MDGTTTRRRTKPSDCIHIPERCTKPESSEFTHFHQPLEEDPRFKHVIDFIEKSITNRQNGQRSGMVIFADYLDTVEYIKDG